VVILPFRMYTSSECASIVSGLRQAVEAWSLEWLAVTPLQLDFRNVNGDEDTALSPLQNSLAVADGIFGVCSTPASVCIAPATIIPERFLQSMLGMDSHEQISADAIGLDGKLGAKVIADGLAELTSTLLGITPGPSDRSSIAQLTASDLARLFTRGAGCGVISMSYKEFDIHLLIGPELVTPYVDPIQVNEIGGLEPVMPALVDERIELIAHLGHTDVTIGDLERLSVGDVVKLDQSIDTSPTLLTRSGEQVVSGRLGDNQGHKALQVY
jgi:hypothetical protein